MTWVGGGLTLKAGETQSKQESQNKKASCTFMDRESTDATAYRIYAISSNKKSVSGMDCRWKPSREVSEEQRNEWIN